ncbi:LysE family translocator [Desulfoluna spongiiphila]|uniref:Threonine/homoserine/homoserine lactone efflux protein n=1 Tax=Desulfoluna spongiiphila TaxID=419481 RepID=A0A1G5BMR1_9BACT|nr:LysE family translocator [Desulfoluna spongiiphila]SCX91449.1 Threonine/homoserine/homoserine lactone efflux protein [Desulfoluna spongiiphila]
MTFQSWLIYIALVVVATATPGPAVFFIMTKSALHGWRQAIFAALGNIAGLFCLGIVAVSGLGIILETSETIYTAVKYAGSLYLMFLGLKLIFQQDPDLGTKHTEFHHAKMASCKMFTHAFGVAVTNPKAIIFLTALFPPFLNHDEALIPQFLVLILVLMGSSCVFLMLYALIVDRATNWFNKPYRMKAIRQTSGSVFVGFGLLMATSSNR